VSKYTNSEISNLEGVTGYNGDITQYLQDKGYMWEQLDESSIKFRRHNESKNKEHTSTSKLYFCCGFECFATPNIQLHKFSSFFL
jgi:hypothetical protein